MLEIGYASDKGRSRQSNEDALLILSKERFFVVADGVGGNNSGEMASGETVKSVADYVRRNHFSDDMDERDLMFRMQECVEEVNSHVLSLSREFPENRGMASTLLMCKINDSDAYIYNVGDSRAYINQKGKLSLITEDHSYVNTLLHMGVITPEEAKHHERGNIITRAIGAEKYVQGDFYEMRLKDGDTLIMCTDGLYGEIEDEDFRNLTNVTNDMQQLADSLIKAANAAGGRDNITVVCLKYRKEAANEQ